MDSDSKPIWKIDDKIGDTRASIRQAFLLMMAENNLLDAVNVLESQVLDVSHHFKEEEVVKWFDELKLFRKRVESQTNRQASNRLRYEIISWYSAFARRIKPLLEQQHQDPLAKAGRLP